MRARLFILICLVSFFSLVFYTLKKPGLSYGVCLGPCGCKLDLMSNQCKVVEDVNPCPQYSKCETWKLTGKSAGWGSLPFVCNSRCVTDPSCKTGNNENGVATAIGCIPLSNLNSFVGWVLPKVIYIASGIAFLLMALGTFQIITSSGDPKKKQAGSELITSALSGLLFIILSIFLLKLIGVDILRLPGLSTGGSGRF